MTNMSTDTGALFIVDTSNIDGETYQIVNDDVEDYDDDDDLQFVGQIPTKAECNYCTAGTAPKTKKKKFFSQPKFVSSLRLKLQQLKKSSADDKDDASTSSTVSISTSVSSLHDLDEVTPRSSDDDKRRNKKSVRFSTVEIREYDVIVGDHPHCTKGLPLAIDWTWNQDTVSKERIDVRLCRKNRCKKHRRSQRGGSSPRVRRLSPKQRRDRLTEFTGLTKTQLKDAEKQRMLSNWATDTLHYIFDVVYHIEY